MNRERIDQITVEAVYSASGANVSNKRLLAASIIVNQIEPKPRNPKAMAKGIEKAFNDMYFFGQTSRESVTRQIGDYIEACIEVDREAAE